MGLGAGGLGRVALGGASPGAPAGSDLTIAGTIAQPVLSVTLSGFNDSDVTIDGSIPQPVLAVALASAAEVDLTIAGTIAQPVLSVTLSGFNDSDVTIVGSIPQPVLAVLLDVAAPSGAWLTDTPRSDALISWAVIGYGRATSNTRTTPVQVSVTLASELAGPCPTIGERFRLQLSDDKAAELGISGSAVRFTGEVTDAIHDPHARRYIITGVGRLGRSSRRTARPKWPREPAGHRARRTLGAAGVHVGVVDGGGVDVLRKLEPVTVATMVGTLSDSTGGQVVEQLTGEVDWHGADHRRGATVNLTLTPAEVLNDLQWSQHVGDVLNDVQVTYGDPARTIRVTDPDSIDERDPFPGTLATILTDKSDAYDLGILTLGRRRDPVWQLPALVVDLRRTVDDPQLVKLLALRHGDRITMADLPAGGPYTGTTDLYVEGLAETATRTIWRLAIAVSDPVLSGVGIRWRDAPSDLTWDDVDPTLTWLDVATLEDPTDLGA